MADTEERVLSQEEIDALLSSMMGEEPVLQVESAEDTQSEEFPAEDAAATPAANGKQRAVKMYDFRRPDKFSKEHLRTLHMLHGDFAKSVSASLSSYLRVGVSSSLKTVEQALYGDYVRLLTSPTILYIFSMDPLPGRAILELNLHLAFIMLDRLLGGPGTVGNTQREVTDIDRALLHNVAANILSALSDAWSTVTPVTASLEDVVLTTQMLAPVSSNDAAAVAKMDIKVADLSGSLSLCYPYTVLEPVMTSLTSHTWLTSMARGSTAQHEKALKDQLSQVDVDVSVQLGEAKVTVRDLLSLQAGDVMTLDTTAGQDLLVLTAGQPKHAGVPGLIGRKLAVQVSRVLDPNEVRDAER